MMDISHESLMRNWERLDNWITEEVRYGKLYKTLNERRELNERDKDQWLGGILLKELIDWRDHFSKNAAWAGRYQQVPKDINNTSFYESSYQKNLQFLADSKAAAEAAKEAEKKKLEEEIARTQKEKARRKIFRVLAAATVISISLVLWGRKSNS